jgi:cell division protein FtsQ
MIAQGLVERLRLRGAARHGTAAGVRGGVAAGRGSGPGPRSASGRTGTRTRVGRRRLSRRARLALLVTVAAGILLAGAWTWFRDSPLVSVQNVTVTGQSGPDAGQISAALESAARTMSTLDVQLGRLRRAIAPYPVVKDIRVTTQFPHGMHIEVVEQVAVGAIDAGGRKVAVAADGTLLRDVVAPQSLPTIPMNTSPPGPRVTTGTASDAIKLLAAAPSQLAPKISQVTTVTPHGLVAQVRGGPAIYFGDLTELPQKWIAAAEVLADPGSAGALYIDVTDPQRPAAGAGTDGQSSQSGTSSGDQSSQSTATGTSATGTTGTSSGDASGTPATISSGTAPSGTVGG